MLYLGDPQMAHDLAGDTAMRSNMRTMRLYRAAQSAVVVLLVSAGLSISASLALAAHYHSVNNSDHGLVHGSSTTDGSFFGRTYPYYIGSVAYCGVGDTDNGINYGSSTNSGNLCSVWTEAYYVKINECRGATYNQVAGGPAPVSYHNHYAHSYGGDCTRYFP